MTGCRLCSAPLEPFADGTVLGSRRVSYVRCTSCRSVFLPDPTWLDEAYSSAISALDVGLLERCIQLANVTTALIAAERLSGGIFLDFAGGYGTLTRLMRDRSLDFRHDDPLCENVFAQGFNASLDRRYDLITAFEVLEHLADPVQTLAPVAALTDFLLVTTQVLPEPAPRPGEWDYFAEDTGQHITFYTVDGLRALGKELDFELTSSGRLVHLFHRSPLRRTTRLLLRDERLSYLSGAVRSEFKRRRGFATADRDAAVRAVQRGRDDKGRDDTTS